MKVIDPVVGHGFAKVGEVATTFRRGFRWATGRDGEELELWRCSESHDGACEGREGCERVGTAVVRGRWVGQFKSALARHVEMEHDETCRTYSGLFAAMKRVYEKFYDQSTSRS